MPKRANGSLQGQVALVTGGNRGVGLAIARALAERGCNLVITGRDQPALNQAASGLARFKTDVLPMMCDIRIPLAVEWLFAVIRGHFAQIDILVNNAGPI